MAQPTLINGVIFDEAVAEVRSRRRVLVKLSARLMTFAAVYLLIQWLLILQASSITG